MNEFETFHELIEAANRSYCGKTALSGRRAGEWHSFSFEEIYIESKLLALGLKRAGINKGDSIGIMGHPSPIWVIVDLAVMSMGAVTVPIFPEEPVETREYKIKDASLKAMFLLDEQACDEMSACSEKLNLIVSAVGDDFVSLSDLLEDGLLEEHEYPDRFDELTASVNTTDLCTIYYTSGSTGNPKGVELTHANIMSQIKAASERLPLFASDTALSCLPLAHSFERFMLYYYIASGVPVYFNSDIHKIGHDLAEIRPTVVGMVPRILEKFHDKFHQRLEGASVIKKNIGSMAEDWAFGRKPGSGFIGWKGIIAKALVFKKLRAALGGGLRVVITGGAAMPPDLYRFFVNAGVPVYQGYGLTEASPVLSANSPYAHKIGTVGLPFPGVDVRITGEGEIVAKGPNIMRSYHNLSEETKHMIDNDGWLHTGDLGILDDDGYLVVTGRKKELLKTSSGEYVLPVRIEQALTKSPLIDMAMVLGEGRPYVTCLLFPAVEMNKLNLALIPQVIDSVNSKLEHWERIREFRIIQDTLTVENGMLTPTMKIRRHMVMTTYGDLINEMYNGKEADMAEFARRAS